MGRKHQRSIGTAALVAMLSACDSLHHIKGEAPAGRDCEVVTTTAYSPPVVHTQKVQGKFSLDYTAGGVPFAPRVNIAAYCDGIKVRELTVSPTLKDTDLGILAP